MKGGSKVMNNMFMPSPDLSDYIIEKIIEIVMN
jgi:hypothetical protein